MLRLFDMIILSWSSDGSASLVPIVNLATTEDVSCT